MNYLLVITCDVNEDDYITNTAIIDDNDFFRNIIDKDMELFENFDERLPFLSGVEVRSIESIEIYELSNKEPIKLV